MQDEVNPKPGAHSRVLDSAIALEDEHADHGNQWEQDGYACEHDQTDDLFCLVERVKKESYEPKEK